MPGYAEVARQYEALVVPRFAPIAKALLQHIDVSVHSEVLELAAGTGGLTRQLVHALAPGARLTVTDLSAPMLEVAKESVAASPRLSFRTADMGGLPFADETFDLVIALFSPLQERNDAASEARRVLRDGGTLALGTWGESYQEAEILRGVRAKVGIPEPPWAGPADAERRLRDAGFRDVQRIDLETLCEHASVEAYLSYRLAFGAYTGLSPDQLAQMWSVLRDVASGLRRWDGSVSLGWAITFLTARR
jgi:SAM-dependent methyltransferase